LCLNIQERTGPLNGFENLIIFRVHRDIKESWSHTITHLLFLSIAILSGNLGVLWFTRRLTYMGCLGLIRIELIEFIGLCRVYHGTHGSGL